VSGGGVAGSGVDQGNLGALTASGSIAININRANDAPTLSAAPPAVAYTEQASAVAVDPALVLGDVDDTQIASASVTIASPVAGDLLAVTTVGGISASFSGGVLTLSGVDSVANYQQVLRSLVYSSSSDDPTVDTTRPGRSLTLSVTDANSDGAGARTTTSTRAIVNLARSMTRRPSQAVGNTRGYTENAAASRWSRDSRWPMWMTRRWIRR
jgi:hypothetical protein